MRARPGRYTSWHEPAPSHRERSNLKEDLHNSEIPVSEFGEAFQNTKISLNREKQRCAELEESLHSNILDSQLDLQDIWRLVQKDVEIECEDFQEDCINTSTPEQIKEQLKREIEALRIKLQKKEAVLGSLKNNNLKFHLTLNYDDIYQTSNWHNGRKLSPSSPLVDALTIDVFNGNLPMYHTNYPYPSSFVSCEDVDCYECRSARLFLQSRFATSCPSIVPSKAGSVLTQGVDSNIEDCKHQINAEDEYSEARTRSFEVTNSADFCASNGPKRKRSIYGNYKRQDFIRSSGRGVKGKTPECSHPSQQSELITATPYIDKNISVSNNNKKSHPSASNKNALNNSFHDISADCDPHTTDDHEPTVGVRRSSFTLAVECNQHADWPPSCNTQKFQTKDGNCSSIEELRRPSFYAAIEQGKEDVSVSDSSPKRKVVQIASPEITESREITASPEKSYRDESHSCSSDLPKTVKFYFDEPGSDIYSGVYAETSAWGSSGQRNSVNAVANALLTSSSSLSSSQSSALMSTSLHSSTSSTAAPDDLSHSLVLSTRYSQEKEQVDAHRLTEKERSQYLTDVRTSECARVREDIPAGMNQHPLTVKDVIKGQKARDGLVHSTAERCIQAKGSKPSFRGHSFNSSSSSNVASTTAGLPSFPSVSSLSTGTPPLPPNSGVPAMSLVKNDKLETTREITQAGVKRSPHVVHNSVDSSNTEVQTRSGKTVIAANAPGSRCLLSAANVTQPFASSKLSKIRQNHLASKKREQMKARSMKLPELREHSELENRTQLSAPTTTDGPLTLVHANTFKDTPQISITDEDADVPPSPSDDVVTPSLPDSFLRKLGLSVTNSSSQDKGEEVSIDQLSEKEIESRFVSLSLAFKTDKLTLDQRANIQERSRDLAEQNVDIELQGLRNAVEALNELVTDAQVRSLLQKIRLHISVLEQATARVSSRAEVYGAVQQEKRLCRAMEVMVTYTENLRRIREKEESELHEARKVLSERSRNILSIDTESSPSRRSLSISGYNSLGRMTRRRSEIVLPRVIGGGGSPSLNPTAALENVPSFLEYTKTFAMSQGPDEREDPKSRFQSAIASTSMQNVVTTTMRRRSLDKQDSTSSSSSLPPSFLGINSPSTLSVNKESGSVSENRGDRAEFRISKDEEAFRKGFEEGLKAKISYELNELRDQQNSISHSLEHMMDKVEQSQLDDEEYFSRPSRLESTLSLASTVGGHVLRYDWRSNKKIIRSLAGLFFVFLAVYVVFLSPPISTVDVRHFTKPPQ